jgi:AbiV family abortive infection protein
MLSPEGRRHLERYWQLSVRFFHELDFALATFFAITLIEEVGKIIILANAKLGSELDRKGFYDHGRKYAYAVYTTLLVNSRVSRIYGPEESRFASWFREGELFNIRNQALYLDLRDGEIVVPHTVVPRGDTFLLVCIAGEVYAEIQGHFVGTGPTQWERILREVDLFRQGKKD